MEKSQPLRDHLGGEEIDASCVPAGSGKARDKTNSDGIFADTKDYGIVAVAALAVTAACKRPGVAITATRRRTRSAITAGTRSWWPSSQLMYKTLSMNRRKSRFSQ